MKKNCHNLRGFTLAEAMMAMVVLAIAAGGVLLPFSSAASVHVEAARRTLAVHLASDLMEEMSAAGYDSIISTWFDYNENRGQIKKALSNDEYSDEVYEHFSRQANCEIIKIGEEAKETELGVMITVTVSFDGVQMAEISTLVSK